MGECNGVWPPPRLVNAAAYRARTRWVSPCGFCSRDQCVCLIPRPARPYRDPAEHQRLVRLAGEIRRALTRPDAVDATDDLVTLLLGVQGDVDEVVESERRDRHACLERVQQVLTELLGR